MEVIIMGEEIYELSETELIIDENDIERLASNLSFLLEQEFWEE
jgi:hypothetical protein